MYYCHFPYKMFPFPTMNLKFYRKNTVRATGVERESVKYFFIKMKLNIQKTRFSVTFNTC